MCVCVFHVDDEGIRDDCASDGWMDSQRGGGFTKVTDLAQQQKNRWGT